MCGILLIDNAQGMDPVRLDAARARLGRRGPDLLRHRRCGQLDLYHSLLHITGSRDWYLADHTDFLCYNGEIYNHADFGDYSNDVELVHQTIGDNLDDFKKFHGPWAWAHWDGHQLRYATDPQGERFLYRYQRGNVTIVASEVALILDLVDPEVDHVCYDNKSWTMQRRTPYRDIERLDPGVLYVDHKRSRTIDSIWWWIRTESPKSDTDWREQFDWTLQKVMAQLQTNIGSTVSFSGGVDSSLLSYYLDSDDFLGIDMIGKDPNIARSHLLLDNKKAKNQRRIKVTPEQYAQEYKELLRITRMPAQSWSFVGKWLVAKHAKNKVIYTGLAADELFGGYPGHLDILADCLQCVSPYSSTHDPDLWSASIEAYQGDSRPATLLMDYWYQVVGVDSPGQDRIGGAWSRETRNPFMHPLMIKLALNLPWHLRVHIDTKVLLKEHFRSIWDDSLLWTKQGFAGHANDALPWLGVDIVPTGDRHQDWKQIAVETFRQICG